MKFQHIITLKGSTKKYIFNSNTIEDSEIIEEAYVEDLLHGDDCQFIEEILSSLLDKNGVVCQIGQTVQVAKTTEHLDFCGTIYAIEGDYIVAEDLDGNYFAVDIINFEVLEDNTELIAKIVEFIEFNGALETDFEGVQCSPVDVVGDSITLINLSYITVKDYVDMYEVDRNRIYYEQCTTKTLLSVWNYICLNYSTKENLIASIANFVDKYSTDGVLSRYDYEGVLTEESITFAQAGNCYQEIAAYSLDSIIVNEWNEDIDNGELEPIMYDTLSYNMLVKIVEILVAFHTEQKNLGKIKGNCKTFEDTVYGAVLVKVVLIGEETTLHEGIEISSESFDTITVHQTLELEEITLTKVLDFIEHL
jgi:hypothetical protein